MKSANECKEEAGKEVEEPGDAVARIWTVGHSTRSSHEFNEILLEHRIDVLVDVRSFPGSRRYPHFNKTELSHTLAAVGIPYYHSPELGGRRRPSPESKNMAWKNPSFRAYADHIESDEFKEGIENLIALIGEKRAAIMCAEALWWRCHRSLIADFLKANGVQPIHIIDAKHTEAHPYTTAARIIDGRLSYEGLLVG